MGNEIKLGDFEDVHALSVSEARAVVTAVHEARKKKDPENNPLRDRIYNDNQYVSTIIEEGEKEEGEELWLTWTELSPTS